MYLPKNLPLTSLPNYLPNSSEVGKIRWKQLYLKIYNNLDTTLVACRSIGYAYM